MVTTSMSVQLWAYVDALRQENCVADTNFLAADVIVAHFVVADVVAVDFIAFVAVI